MKNTIVPNHAFLSLPQSMLVFDMKASSMVYLCPMKNDAYHIKKRKYANDRYKRLFKERRIWFDTYKATLKCSRCDESFPYCLDFHHRDSTTKKFHIGQGVNQCRTIKAILAEISKCDILCANCHRKLTYSLLLPNPSLEESE